MTWREAIDNVFEESKWELDKLREHGLKKPLRSQLGPSHFPLVALMSQL